MDGRGSLLWAAGAAAAVALAAWAWRREQQVAAAAAATSGGAGTRSPPAAPKLGSTAPAAPAPDEQQEAEAAAATAAAAAAAEQQAARERAERERAAAARRRSSPLYRVTPNERIVHEMLLSGQEGGLAFLEPGELEPEAAAAAAGAPPRMAAGRGTAARSAATAAASAAAAPAPSEEAAAAEDVRRSVVSVVEQAFFDALAEGLRHGKTQALASLLLDARDQLAALLPQHPPGGAGSSGARASEGAQLLSELREKLDGEYVEQRLERYDAAFASQCFDFLVHMIGRLQAPARRQHTQQAYGEVAARFAAAAQADAAAAAPAAPAEEPSSGSAAGAGDAAAAAAAGEDGRVQLQLDFDGSDSQRVAVRLLPAAPSAVTTASATSTAASSAGGSRPQLEWQLRLAPRPDGGMAAVLVPVEVGADAAAPTAEAQQAGVAGGGSAGTSTSACSSASAPAGSEGRIGEGSIAAVVAAARFMHHQLNELKADVAAARLSLLKEAILGNGSAIEYERQRYLRALQQPGDSTASGGASSTASSGSGSAAAEAVADACPLAAAWLKETLQQAQPPPGLEGPAFTQAAVESGLLLLLQRTQAVGPADCPETLLLDLEAVVVLQNELQRLCLVAASLLVVQQILAAQRALPPSGSPRHAALCQRLVRRVGLLLSSGANLEALAVELHSQIEQEMAAAGAEQQAAAGTAGSGEGAAASSSAASGSSGGGGACPVELATVRRMIEGIFSTSHTVYQRVQAGIVAALTALLRSAGAPSTSAGGSRSGSPAPESNDAAPGQPAAAAAAAPSAVAAGATWRKVLRGVGAEALAPEVLRLGAALHRIASVSSAVAGPVVYAPLLAALQAAAPAWQRRRH